MSRNTLLYIEDLTVGNELAGEESGWVRRDKPEWFSIEPLSGSEPVVANQVQAQASHKLESTYLPNCTPRVRLTAGADANNPTRTFNISSVVNVDEKNRNLTWMATEVV